MTRSLASPGLVHFPSLHPALAPDGLPETVRFLDPGLGAADDPSLWRPDGLPLGDAALAGFSREFERLKAEVRNPKDLALLASASNGHFFTATSFAVREELEDRAHPERVAKRRLTAAQLTLCLAWMVEESLLELSVSAALEDRFRAAMAESLGLAADGDDAEEAAALAAVVAGPSLPAGPALAEEFGVPFERLLSPVWAVLPPEAGLYVSDLAIAATWREAGLVLASPDAATAGDLPGLDPGAVLTARETGWRLLGRTRPQAEAPWLDRPRLLVVPRN